MAMAAAMQGQPRVRGTVNFRYAPEGRAMLQGRREANLMVKDDFRAAAQ